MLLVVNFMVSMKTIKSLWLTEWDTFRTLELGGYVYEEASSFLTF
ncbi:MAG: hypothetical protein ACD_22C00256G0023 [uncultured bacterium]|nr:MAG: hypothetical protein ACD_22C00256G0023 [uncultured bacterium]